ncbi:type II toxin-antitoxin system PemK/MazF family toxin [Nocardia stercoris]|uniref:Type II toxin-antitoxin system PemK/MazF family toxin n=1 Tax=Nocardia stercoris TaxID=2483361 RepID=A0A3M2KZH3_9NOCA|nr:type II toxin-antitoxin system PemK/MazF family toxin [Nocardia stercoris]RMI29840.1 hypothetical protein EBN03_23870 [Nocardia stercoris]
MKRGEVWTCAPMRPSGEPMPGRRPVIVVSDTSVIDSPYRWLHVVPLHDSDPGHLLATKTAHGWANALEIHPVYRPWLTEAVGALTEHEAESLDARLRATVGL